MITLREDVRSDGYHPETFFNCDSCGGLNSFYSVSPKKCRTCLAIFTDMRALKLDCSYRVRWHVSDKSLETKV